MYELEDYSITIECDECHGDGTQEVRDCRNWSNECCGGCFVDVECQQCKGTGTIEVVKIDYVEDGKINLI